MNYKKRILIVDDDHDIAFTFKKGLEKYGYDIDIYTNPLIALTEFEEYSYDLLLIDIRMPKMSGFELYAQLRKKDKEFKICFITSFETYYNSLSEFFPTLNVKSFIRKPISIDELDKRIKELLKS